MDKPWHLLERGDVVRIENNCDHLIAEVHINPIDEECCKKNARIIAEAPEMYRLLLDLQHACVQAPVPIVKDIEACLRRISNG